VSGDKGRHIIVGAETADPSDRLDLVVHALAQLPSDLSLELQVGPQQAGSLLALAKAYGVAGQIDVRGEAGAGGTVVYPSQSNFQASLARLKQSPSNSILLTEDGGSEEHGGRAPGVKTVRSLGELVESLSRDDDRPAPCRADVGLLEGQRIALVTNVPIHYRIPLWNRLARRLESAGAQLRVFFAAADPTRARPWLRHAPIEFDHVLLATRSLGLGGDLAIDLERRLRDFRPTQVLSAGFSPAVSGRAAHLANRKDVPFGLWSGDTVQRARQRGRFRYVQRFWIARMSTYAIAYSWRAAEYLRGMAPDLPTVIVRNTTAVAPDQGSVRSDAQRGGEPGRVEFLSVARAIPGKRLDLAVDAFRLAGELPCRLTMVGDGPELPALKRRARNWPGIEFVGAVPSDRVLTYFATADAFVFPSEIDVFGLALVEAMGSGLSTITSDRPGAAGDLAVDGVNALVLRGSSADQWAEAIRTLALNPDLRTALGQKARRTVNSRWTPEHSVDAWIAGFCLGVIAGDRQRPA
jgi:glycosyltransferase involved in cell wall biosynthesis